MISNAALAIAIETLNGNGSGNATEDEIHLQAKQHTYFSLILWATFGLAFVRFTGVSSFYNYSCLRSAVDATSSVPLLFLPPESLQMLPPKLNTWHHLKGNIRIHPHHGVQYKNHVSLTIRVLYSITWFWIHSCVTTLRAKVNF